MIRRRAFLGWMSYPLLACGTRTTRVLRPAAAGDGVRDDSAAIQSAIDECAQRGGGTVAIPAGVFRVGATSFIGHDGVVAGARSLWLRDNVILRGEGAQTIIRLEKQAYGPGAAFAIIGSDPDAPLRNASIENLVLDGNSSQQVANIQAGNILLECSNAVRVTGVESRNANGTSIMLRGRPDRIATDVSVSACVVEGASFIGIQLSQFENGQITDNRVSNTKDNGIDIYGEVGTTRASTNRFLIARNHVTDASVGILVETCRDGEVLENDIRSASVAAVGVNRINGEPRNILISKNSIDRCNIGVRVTGDTGGVTVTTNTIKRFAAAGIVLGGEGGNVSRVDVVDNIFLADDRSTPLLRVAGEQASFLRASKNHRGDDYRVGVVQLSARRTVAVDVGSLCANCIAEAHN